MNYEEQVNTPFSQATNEFHAGSDTRCDEENDFDAIFGIVLLPSHTHNYAQSFSTIGVGIFAFLSQEREREGEKSLSESSKQPIKCQSYKSEV